MADEALNELLEELRRTLKAREDMLRIEGMDVDDPSIGYRGDPDYYRRNNVITAKVRARVDALESALSELARLRAEREWKPIETAPKDDVPILVLMKHDLPLRSEGFAGLQFVATHSGIISGFDAGWRFAAPVGMGGFPDEWIVGWQPLPAQPVQSHEEKQG